jgi:hypothetical protein
VSPDSVVTSQPAAYVRAVPGTEVRRAMKNDSGPVSDVRDAPSQPTAFDAIWRLHREESRNSFSGSWRLADRHGAAEPAKL